MTTGSHISASVRLSLCCHRHVPYCCHDRCDRCPDSPLLSFLPIVRPIVVISIVDNEDDAGANAVVVPAAHLLTLPNKHAHLLTKQRQGQRTLWLLVSQIL